MKRNPLLKINNCGLYCEDGDFYIDPWKSVDKALITHSHSDHARWGSKSYLTSEKNVLLLKTRLGEDINVESLKYGEVKQINNIKVSFHPAGHVLGSSQIRLERDGEVWVASGDYKIHSDKTCESFEPIKCNVFITESTFGLPIYKWCSNEETFRGMNEWIRKNQSENLVSVIFGYSLGKAQRIISNIENDAMTFTHGAVESLNSVYRSTGVNLPPTYYAGNYNNKADFKNGIVIAPQSANTVWLNRFGDSVKAFASGWMQVRGQRRRSGVDKGFILSDHVDWDGLNKTIKETGAEKILVTHGYSSVVVKWLKENNIDAEVLPTKYEGETITSED